MALRELKNPVVFIDDFYKRPVRDNFFLSNINGAFSCRAIIATNFLYRRNLIGNTFEVMKKDYDTDLYQYLGTVDTSRKDSYPLRVVIIKMSELCPYMKSVPALKGRFWNLFVVDALIENSKRNNEDCNTAVMRVVPKINRDEIEGIINVIPNLAPNEIPIITKVQRKVYHADLELRYQHELSTAYNSIRQI